MTVRDVDLSELRDALAELSDAVTADLVAEPSSLPRLIEARDRADALLGRSPVIGRSPADRCRCNLSTGFHQPDCEVARG